MTDLLTKAQQEALVWFSRAGGTGVFDKNGVLLAAGKRAPVMRSTWNRLREIGLVVAGGDNRRRLNLTDAGRKLADALGWKE